MGVKILSDTGSICTEHLEIHVLFKTFRLGLHVHVFCNVFNGFYVQFLITEIDVEII